MDKSTYRVIFNGKIVEGQEPEKVLYNLARLFKIDKAKVKQRLSPLPAVIVKNVDRTKAENYVEVLKKAGILCHIEAEKQEKAKLSQRKSPAKEDETVRIKVRPDMDDLKAGETRTKKYKLIYNGKTIGNIDEETAKEKIAALFKVDKSKIDKKLSPLPATIISDIDYDKALQYSEKFKQAGLMCSIEMVNAEKKADTGDKKPEKPKPELHRRSSTQTSPKPQIKASTVSMGMGKSQAVIHGSPSFAYIDIELAPGESIVAESDAMASMSADLEVKASFNGGFFSGLLKKYFGGESLFINTFTNNSLKPRKLVLTQATPGDIRAITLSDEHICLQPGAYICSTPELKLGVKWAGFTSWFAREGLFKLDVSGTGTVFYGAYGGLLEKEIDGEYIVDTSHLVAYEPQMKLKLQLAGGLFSSFFGGEGFVTRVEGNGKIIIQTRSMSGLAGWLNPKLY